MKSLTTQWNKAQQFFEDFLWAVQTISLPAHPGDRRKTATVGGWVWTVAKLDMTAFFGALAFQDARVQSVLVMSDKDM